MGVNPVAIFGYGLQATSESFPWNDEAFEKYGCDFFSLQDLNLSWQSFQIFFLKQRSFYTNINFHLINCKFG